MHVDALRSIQRFRPPVPSDDGALGNQLHAGRRLSTGRPILDSRLPGVDQDSIDLEVEKNTLTITAERKWENGEGTTVILSERPQGTFSRQFFLGEGLDADKIEAGYDAGVLTISIPVAEQAKPRKISIGVNDRVLTS